MVTMAKTVNKIRETLTIPASCRERFLPIQSDSAQALRQRHVFQAGLSDLGAGYEIGRVRAFHHVLHYTISGSGKLILPDRTIRFKPGSLLLAPARSTYGYRITGAKWRIMWFHLTDNEYWWALKQSETMVRPSYLIDNLEATMSCYLGESLKDDAGAQRSAQLLAEVIGSYLDREVEENMDPVARKMHHRLWALWDHVNSDLQNSWTVATLAGQMHMSTVHFHRIAMQYGGVSPMQMVTHLRMQRAKELLTHDYPLKVVAELVGYENQFAFSTAFKRHVGTSPREYRKRLASTSKKKQPSATPDA
jgi:AraC-like DNA-binding protein